ncbi:MAG: S-layer homology domain-containing protein [bacterium]|nr:S-layer homology domain-containing protein [bacterium]
MKKIYVFLMMSIITFFLLWSHIASAASFSDVSQDHSNGDAIFYVQSNGIVSGYPDGSFKPDNKINRAEFTKIVVGAQLDPTTIDHCIDKHVSKGLNTVFFPDVPKDEWFAKYVCAAKMANIISGYSDGTFRPTDFINFAETAKVISTAYAFSVNEDPIWYKPFVDQLADRNAIPDTIKSFEARVNRGEMAEMIYRLEADVTTQASLDYEWIQQLDPAYRTMTLQVSFTTLKDNENLIDCDKTGMVTRTLSFTTAPALIALEQLFLGPSEGEKTEGMLDFWITEETAHNLKRVFIRDGTAYLDWKDISKVIPNVGTSCGSASFLSPIEETLRQFPTVTRVVHAIDGQPSLFYDWIQVGCTEEDDFCDESPYQTEFLEPEVHEFNLRMIFYPQSPYGNWNLPYQEACEEASLLLSYYYLTGIAPDRAQFHQDLLDLIEWQTGYFGQYIHTSIAETAEMADKVFGLNNSMIIENPTVDELKNYVSQGFPILVPTAARELGNLYFRGTEQFYHMLVLRGYDEKNFITNDVGTSRGENYLYPYDVLLKAIHDLNPDVFTDPAAIENGEKRVLVIMPN